MVEGLEDHLSTYWDLGSEPWAPNPGSANRSQMQVWLYELTRDLSGRNGIGGEKICTGGLGWSKGCEGRGEETCQTMQVSLLPRVSHRLASLHFFCWFWLWNACLDAPVPE